MTGLDRGVTRETNCIDTTRSGRRRFVVRLEEGGRRLLIRPKGTRRWYPVPWEAVWRLAIGIRAQEIKAEKLARKKARAAK
jgi:hypothetical protein